MSEHGGGGYRFVRLWCRLRVSQAVARCLCATARPGRHRGGLRRDRVGVGAVLRGMDHQGHTGKRDRAAPACRSVLVIGLLSVVSGLLAGLYRGRHQRGSLDEVVSVSVAGGLMLVPLLLLSESSCAASETRCEPSSVGR